MIDKIANYFIISFMAYTAVYATNTFGIAESTGQGIFAFLKILTISLMFALFMAYTDKPMFKLIEKIMRIKSK